MKKVLPKEITSHDLLKTIAVLLMVADHVGYYLFPEEIWWRVAGRLSVPFWFFLLGYARSRNLDIPLWLGCGILVLANIPAGMSLLPLNILGTIIFIRLVLDSYMKHALKNKFAFWGMNIALVCLIVPSSHLMEYGTAGLILAIFGRMCREQLIYKDNYMLFALSVFATYQFLVFGFGQIEFMVLCLGLLAVFGWLYFFSPKIYTGTASSPITPLIHFTGRHTMAIYIGHLLILKTLGVLISPERFVMWDWKFLSMTGM